SSAIRRRPEPNLRVQGQSCQALVEILGPAEESADFSNNARRQGDEIARRKTVDLAGRMARMSRDCDRSHRAWRHDVGSGGRNHQAFCQAAPLPLLGNADQVVRLESSQMVVDLLTRDA